MALHALERGFVALSLDQCGMGERRTYPQTDEERIICIHQSDDGTATYYAACMDKRIKVAMPSAVFVLLKIQ